MANQSILALTQTALQAMGVVAYGQPSSVVGNSNQDVMQTLALVTAAGDELAREFQWQALCKDYRFTTVFYQYTGNTTANSTSVTGMSSITGLTSDSTFLVTGTGINTDTYVQAASGTTVTLTQPATSTNTGITLTFAQSKYALPSDWDRQIDYTQFDKTKRWQMIGPESAQQWQWLKSSYISTGPRLRYRIAGNYFQIWPAISSNEYLGFEYISKYWVLASADQVGTKKTFTVDTDTAIFSDPLMVALIRLKYFEAKGFDTTALLRAFNDQKEIAMGHDAGSPTLSMAPRISPVLISPDQVPDTKYGS